MSHLPNNQMASGSDFYSTKPELSGLKNHKIISGVFEGKCPSDYESAWSPTSPLDFRVFSSLGNPFGGSSIRKGHQKSWDSGKVGLSIVDTLDDHHIDSSRILLPSPDSKNITFGSRMRSENTKCQKPHLPNPVVEELSVLSQPFAKPMEKDDKPNDDLIELDSSYCLCEENISVNNNASQVIKQPLRSLNGRIESDIEISEEYTCVISHGPNPKTTHFYGDQVLESVEPNMLKKHSCENKKESIFVISRLDFTTPIDVIPSNDFLSFCCFCSKKLSMGKDIYLYRGYKAFCSSECRSEEIQLDEKMEEEEDKDDEEEATMSDSSSDKDLSKKKSKGVIFTVG